MLRHLTAAVAALFLVSCQTETAPPKTGEAAQVAPILDTPDAVDAHSYAKPLEARVTNVALDLNVDFDAKQVGGTATLDIQAKPDAKEIILDDKGLVIESVADEAGNALPFKVGPNDAAKGAPLSVQMGDKRKIVIRYKSGPDAAALQWLTPEQTAGKKHPYLLSQGQPTLNRTWIPTQDSPGIRQTWSAKVTAPEPLKVVMSGERLTPDGEPAGEGRRSYSFRMDKPVAP